MMEKGFKLTVAALAASALVCACGEDKTYGEPDIRQPHPEMVTVHGCVASEGKPLAGVSVSDGVKTAVTDAAGNYTIKTSAPNGYVFISTPDGYEPAEMSDGNRPKFWKAVDKLSDAPLDFELRKTSSKPLALIAIADPQISDRCGDVELLRNMIVPDLNRTADSLRNLGKEPVVLTLGDIICDYFIVNGAGYTLDRFNADFKVNAPVYHTIGNHDHDPYIAGDEASAATWHAIQGPTYYSFNRGGAHIVVLDNMIYHNDGATPSKAGKRNYSTGLTERILNWVENDLETTDPSTPVFVAMHGPLMTYAELNDGFPSKTWRFDDGAAQLGMLLRKFDNVKVLTGHAHKTHNTLHPQRKIREYNLAGANGGWWPAALKPHKPNLPVCLDGTPWGYAVFTAGAGTETQVYKSFCQPLDHQMRIYDLNETSLPSQYSQAYLPGANENCVLANIWNYEEGCKVRFLENGTELKVKQYKAVDPWFVNRYIIPVENEYGNYSGMEPEATTHLFLAKASTPGNPVTVEFTDRSGRVFTQTLARQ